jgi:hypothetical protein
LVPGTTLVLKFFLKVLNAAPKFFKNILGPKIKGIWTGTNTQKKCFSEFFSSISWGLCTGTKREKVVLFRFSTGIKGNLEYLKNKNLIFHSETNFSLLNQKSNTFFAFGTGTKFFLGICTVPNTLFLGLKNF